MAVAVDVRYVMDNMDKTKKSAITKQCPNWNFHSNMVYAKTMASANSGAGRIQILSNLILFVMEMCVKILVILNIDWKVSQKPWNWKTIGLQLRLIYGCGDDFLQLAAIIYIFFASQKTTCFQIKLHRRDFAITLAENDITLVELDSPTLYALTKQTANL